MRKPEQDLSPWAALLNLGGPTQVDPNATGEIKMPEFKATVDSTSFVNAVKGMQKDREAADAEEEFRKGLKKDFESIENQLFYLRNKGRVPPTLKRQEKIEPSSVEDKRLKGKMI